MAKRHIKCLTSVFKNMYINPQGKTATYSLDWLTLKRQKLPSAGMAVNNRNSHTSPVGIQNYRATFQ